MLGALKSLPEDPTELRAVSERLMAEVQSLTYQNEKLKAELAFAILLEHLAHVDKRRIQSRMDVMCMKPRKLSAVLS